MTRRLLLVAAVAAMLGLVATPALEDTTVGGWFVVPWDGSRGLGQPGQQGEPTAPPPTLDRQGGNGGQRRLHANPARMVIDRRSDAQGQARHAGGHKATGTQPPRTAAARSPVVRIVAGLATTIATSCWPSLEVIAHMAAAGKGSR